MPRVRGFPEHTQKGLRPDYPWREPGVVVVHRRSRVVSRVVPRRAHGDGHNRKARMSKAHQLWRLPLSGRLHLDRNCQLLLLERSLPSPRDHDRARIEHVTKRRSNTAPISQDFKDLSSISSQLCSCARHLLAK
jgi:hypothetical protein